MKNLYVGQFKDVLKMFYEKQNTLIKEIKANYEKFSPEYAEQENAKVREKQAQAYAHALQSINSIFETVKASLANATFLNPESISQSTLVLFDDANSFNLTEEDIYSQIERHEGNFTMLRFIQNWIDRHNESGNDTLSGKYDSVKINMPYDILMAYKAFADSALSICDTIYTDDLLNPAKVEYYADENFGESLYKIIGTGMNLSNYQNMIVPETVKHTFDNINLNLVRDNGNIFVQ